MNLLELYEKLERLKHLKSIPYERLTVQERDELYHLRSIELKVVEWDD